MNTSRRAFLGAMLITPVVGLAIMKRAVDQERPLIASREDFYRESRAAWMAEGEYAQIAHRYMVELARSMEQARREAIARFADEELTRLFS